MADGWFDGALKSDFDTSVDAAVEAGDLSAVGKLMKLLHRRLQNEEIVGCEGRGLLLKVEKDVVVLQEQVKVFDAMLLRLKIDHGGSGCGGEKSKDD